MAPEQATTGAAHAEADIFAWASTVVFAASGEQPFRSGSPSDVLYRVVHERPVVPVLPEPLNVLVRRAFEKDPTQRPTASELSRMLSNDSATDDGATQIVLGTAVAP